MSHMPIAVLGLLEGPEMSVTAENGVFWGLFWSWSGRVSPETHFECFSH